MTTATESGPRIGNYHVRIEQDSFRIFPRNRQGESVPVTIYRNYIHLTSIQTGRTTTFKRFLHQKRWYWSDSRRKGSVPEHHIQSELSRMLFKGDGSQALNLMACAVLNLPIEHLAG